MVTVATAEAKPLMYRNNLVKAKALLPDIDGLVILFAIYQHTFQEQVHRTLDAHIMRGVGFEPTNPSPSRYSTLRDDVLSNAENSLTRAVDQAGRPPQEPLESPGRDKKNQTP